MKIIFAGTPDFAVAPFRALAKEHEIVAAFTQPDRKAGRGKKIIASPVKQYAQQINIPIFQPTSLKDKVDLIRSLNADAIIVVAYGMLLPQEVLDIPPLGCINIHASLLPRWRGAAPIQRAIEAGDTQTGVSIMRMELGLDTGPVYQSLSIEISESDTSQTLHDRLSTLGAKGVCETLSQLIGNPNLIPCPQDDSLANYASKITKTEATMDWNKTAKELQQQSRAFIPWPISETHHKGTRLRIWQSSVINNTQLQVPAGTIVGACDQGIEVACGCGVLRLEQLQRDGSKPMIYSEFRNGYQMAIGDLVGDRGTIEPTSVRLDHPDG